MLTSGKVQHFFPLFCLSQPRVDFRHFKDIKTFSYVFQEMVKIPIGLNIFMPSTHNTFKILHTDGTLKKYYTRYTVYYLS